MNGTRLQNLTTNRCQRYGELLTVTRPKKVGGAATSNTYYFIPVPLTVEGARELNLEGGGNLAAENAHNFVTSVNSTVRENDTITYQNLPWTVLTVIPRRIGGVSVDQNCIAVREKSNA